MFKTTVTNSSQQFWLQKEISETGGVDTNVRALFVSALVVGGVTFSGGGGWLDSDLLGIGVVQQFFLTFVRHGVSEFQAMY